jgi:glutathione synthase
LYAHAHQIKFENEADFTYSTEAKKQLSINDLDLVVNRVDPPFNKEYLYLTQLLELSAIECINSARSLREHNEKLIILNFPELIPETLVTNSVEEITNFMTDDRRKIVIKPLDGMGGKSIFYVEKNDKNLNVIWETITQNGRKHVIAQEYVPEAVNGDNRLTFINYELLPKKVVRVPSDSDFRGNLAVGATSVIETVNDDDIALAEKIIPFLKDNNIYFAGADLLGTKLSEINITSPTCLQEIHNNSDLNPAAIFWDNLKSTN